MILSRALAPLSILLKLLADLGGGKSILLLPKGKNWLKEVNEAKKIWYFSYNAVKNNRILEWDREYVEFEPGHRHMSHLYGFHPGNQITKSKTPKLFKSIKNTLEEMFDIKIKNLFV